MANSDAMMNGIYKAAINEFNHKIDIRMAETEGRYSKYDKEIISDDDIKHVIKTWLYKCNVPIFHSSHVLYALGWHSRGQKSYRRVMACLRQLRTEGFLCSENWHSANNTTVWWMKSAINENWDIPY